MNLRARLSMFTLTKEEQRTIAFIVLAVILGLVTQHYRHRRSAQLDSPNDIEEARPAPVFRASRSTQEATPQK
jgi:hypothetical protein